MNAAQTIRLETIIERFDIIQGRYANETRDGAMRFLRVLARSDIELSKVLAEMSNSLQHGYAVPAIRLGLVKAGRTKGTWMANARIATERLSLADAVEMYGSNVKI